MVAKAMIVMKNIISKNNRRELCFLSPFGEKQWLVFNDFSPPGEHLILDLTLSKEQRTLER